MFRNGLRKLKLKKIKEELDKIKNPFKEYHFDKEDGKYILEMPVPGFDKEDIKIKLIKNDLSVVIESEDNQWTPPLNKRFGLPDDFDRKKIKLGDGFTLFGGSLLVRFPKLSSFSFTCRNFQHLHRIYDFYACLELR